MSTMRILQVSIRPGVSHAEVLIPEWLVGAERREWARRTVAELRGDLPRDYRVIQNGPRIEVMCRANREIVGHD